MNWTHLCNACVWLSPLMSLLKPPKSGSAFWRTFVFAWIGHFAVIFLMFLNWLFWRFCLHFDHINQFLRIIPNLLIFLYPQNFFFLFVLIPWSPMHVDYIFLVCGLLLEHRQPFRGYTLKNADSASCRSYTVLLIVFWPELGSLCPLTQ